MKLDKFFCTNTAQVAQHFNGDNVSNLVYNFIIDVIISDGEIAESCKESITHEFA
jgi:hypothetical protein